MKVTGLNGNEYSWNPHIDFRGGGFKSQYHLSAKALLEELFPFDNIYEEVPLPGSQVGDGRTLVADFCIPSQKLIVEVHGEQHYIYTPYYHKTKLGFIKCSERGRDKIRWCNLNGITIIILKYNEEIDEWRRQIIRRQDT